MDLVQIIRSCSDLFIRGSLTDAPSTINWISAFSEFNRYMAIFRKFFESKRKCKCLIIITLPFWLVPCLFARFESFSSEGIIPLDFNEFLSVRYMFQLRCKVTHFHEKRAEWATFYSSSHRIEYDSSSLRGICCSIAVLRQSLIAARTSSITSDASWCSIM